MPSTAAEPSAGDSRPPLFLSPPGSLEADVVVLSGPEGRHAATVRRIAPGERIDLADGGGMLAECVVTAARPGALELRVVSRHREPLPDPVVTVVQALPKGDRGLLAVDLLTEAGVDVVVPWSAQRCVTRWQGERGERVLARWRATAQEASKQARRPRLPVVTPLAATAEVASRVAGAALAVLLEPASRDPLGAIPLPDHGEIMVIVGPEGGTSPAEVAQLTAAGAVPVRLGPSVLRTSSAGMAAAAVVLSRCGRWG
jgi:16S rRNA (uracil1498-N3)-methyltransferase